MSANIEQIKAMLERTGKTNLLQKEEVDLNKERLQLEATVKSLEKAAEDSLQQEQPEVDLEKEIKEELEKLGGGHGGFVDDLIDDDLMGFALHFYELGQRNVRKE